MSLKSKFKIFVPGCVIIALNLCRGYMCSINIRLKKCAPCVIKENTIFVIGTGPSLKKTISKYGKLLQTNPCIAVNGFATNDVYEQIRPSYYCLADPAYFKSYSQTSERIQKVVAQLRESLITKTTWPITFLFPISAKNSELQSALKNITDSKFLYYNDNGNPNVLPDGSLKYWCWNKQLMAPLAQTVLNTALSLSISSEVKNIYLVGADSSWLSTYEIDQSDNTLYTKDEHFYGVKKVPMYKDETNKEKLELHTELISVSMALQAYWTLNDYANYNGVKLYNSSEYSWIDALERFSLDNF